MPSPETIDLLVIVTAAGEQVGELTQQLTRDGFGVTRVGRGDLLQDAPVSLLIGLNQADLPRLLGHVRTCCRPQRRFIPTQVEMTWRESLGAVIEAEVGGAVVYALAVERFEQL